MAAAIVKREFFSPPTVALGGSASRAPTFNTQWREVLSYGIELGNPGSPVKLVEFTDLECPFCSRFHQSVLPAILEQFDGKVSAVFVHFPLDNHRFAQPAARAAECAGEQEAFASFVESVFAKQDSLGLRSWGSYAVDASVADTIRFNACLRTPNGLARIAAGRAAAIRFGVRGTPGIMVNGWLFPVPPSEADLSRTIAKVIAAHLAPSRQ